ncbi:MAG: type II toxin-antitoxin system PrlF family antitoxin [Deltaproteobacteria bacterium]|nr:type II toxin-antitoxin system PrlF family antitoxin [Deltaproteobacteria bacterium]
MITSTVTSKGQVTIPKAIRDFLKVEKYDKIVFLPLRDRKVMMTTKRAPASDLFGMLKYRNSENLFQWKKWKPKSTKGDLKG